MSDLRPPVRLHLGDQGLQGLHCFQQGLPLPRPARAGGLASSSCSPPGLLLREERKLREGQHLHALLVHLPQESLDGDTHTHKYVRRRTPPTLLADRQVLFSR